MGQVWIIIKTFHRGFGNSPEIAILCSWPLTFWTRSQQASIECRGLLHCVKFQVIPIRGFRFIVLTYLHTRIYLAPVELMAWSTWPAENVSRVEQFSGDLRSLLWSEWKVINKYTRIPCLSSYPSVKFVQSPPITFFSVTREQTNTSDHATCSVVRPTGRWHDQPRKSEDFMLWIKPSFKPKLDFTSGSKYRRPWSNRNSSHPAYLLLVDSVRWYSVGAAAMWCIGINNIRPCVSHDASFITATTVKLVL